MLAKQRQYAGSISSCKTEDLDRVGLWSYVGSSDVLSISLQIDGESQYELEI
jgi:hypothetical protein